MILTVLLFCLIFVGVTVALYQVYEINFLINFGNEDKLPDADKQHLESLTRQANAIEDAQTQAAFEQQAADVLGSAYDREMALKAFTAPKSKDYAIPLLRRKQRLNLRDEASVRHFPGFKSPLPRFNIRVGLITLVIVNCVLTQFFGAMSIYTLLYPVTEGWLVWLNEPLILMLLIYALIAFSYGISHVDRYAHDLYQIGQLRRHAHGDSVELTHKNA